MQLQAPKTLRPWGMFVFAFLLPMGLAAQTATLSGTATDSKGAPIANATVAIKAESGTTAATVRTDAEGNYTIPNLAPGEYTISAAGNHLSSREIKVTITSVAHQTLDLLMNPVQLPELPNAPGAAPSSSPSLEDLGFSTQQTQANTRLQAMLEKRTRMLKVHQKLGLITVIPMAAALITGPMANVEDSEGGVIRKPTTANLDFHAALGGATAALYFTTAYYSMFAPRVPGTTKRGPIRLHEALALIHGPGMILTPILGAMAYNQENSGQKAHGIAAQHGTVAYVTAIAYGASIVAVSWPIHVKFWERR